MGNLVKFFFGKFCWLEKAMVRTNFCDGLSKSRHPRTGGSPGIIRIPEKDWIPVFTGMTEKGELDLYTTLSPFCHSKFFQVAIKLRLSPGIQDSLFLSILPTFTFREPFKTHRENEAKKN